mmetsp:Transcript_2452/g.8687  ORF Transcript_2452/g.8687 Transcript_2452/m.8687 type:complete len:212 (-) Transcript_2452:2173-2808(-)
MGRQRRASARPDTRAICLALVHRTLSARRARRASTSVPGAAASARNARQDGRRGTKAPRRRRPAFARRARTGTPLARRATARGAWPARCCRAGSARPTTLRWHHFARCRGTGAPRATLRSGTRVWTPPSTPATRRAASGQARARARRAAAPRPGMPSTALTSSAALGTRATSAPCAAWNSASRRATRSANRAPTLGGTLRRLRRMASWRWE